MTEESENYDMDEMELDEVDERTFREMLSSILNIRDQIERSSGLQDAVDRVKETVDAAQTYMSKHSEDWFDNVTVKRHAKYLADAEKTFNKASKENLATQKRLEDAYRDIISILKRYLPEI